MVKRQEEATQKGENYEAEDENKGTAHGKRSDGCSSGSHPVNSTIGGDLAGKVEETCGVERSFSGGLAEEPVGLAGQSWDCSQVEDEPDESDAVEWLVDTELMR